MTSGILDLELTGTDYVTSPTSDVDPDMARPARARQGSDVSAHRGIHDRPSRDIERGVRPIVGSQRPLPTWVGWRLNPRCVEQVLDEAVALRRTGGELAEGALLRERLATEVALRDYCGILAQASWIACGRGPGCELEVPLGRRWSANPSISGPFF
jgi:hypothetical protein